MKTYRSHARWKEGTVAFSMDGSQITTDDHYSEEEAQGVCRMLERDGYGGDNKLYPVETWVTPIPFEEQYPEEAQILADLCAERAEAKARGERIKPIYLDEPSPIIMTYKNNHPSYESVATIVRSEDKIGRNEPCPCGSGKKYKKCCQ